MENVTCLQGSPWFVTVNTMDKKYAEYAEYAEIGENGAGSSAGPT
ncbi:hypothetical protein ABZ826_30105 [Streptomyces sp. NPDC047515]